MFELLSESEVVELLNHLYRMQSLGILLNTHGIHDVQMELQSMVVATVELG